MSELTEEHLQVKKRSGLYPRVQSTRPGPELSPKPARWSLSRPPGRPAWADLARDTTCFRQLRPDSELVRCATWGPVVERRYRLTSGLLVELGLTSAAWARLALDPGTYRVLGDGHRILHDPHGLLAGAREWLNRVASGD